jgi:hypothetical protein
MKKKTLYTALLICFSLVASSNKNMEDEGCRCNNLCKSRSLPNSNGGGAGKEADANIPAATGYLPGYSILLLN